MKISQLFERKTNPSQQPRCCHKRNDGSECKAHPRKGRQYCFLHDPASQKKSASARRAGGVIRGYKAQNEAVLKLPPNLPALPLEDAAAINQMFRETVNHFRQGEMDLRSANCIRNFGLAMLRGFEFQMRAQREAARAAAPRTSAGKKLPLPVRVTVRDIVTGELYQVPNQNGHSAAKPPSPGQPNTKQDTKEDQPDQGRQSVSPASAAGAQTQAQQLNEQNEPQPNGYSALSPHPPSAQPVSPPPKENQPSVSAERAPDAREQSARAQQRNVAEPSNESYPPGLGPRYLTVATPGTPRWRRERLNSDW
jgi:hypothetical protein